jgi:4-hydroxy-3-polyprenylbenzoate decarboxylase
MGGATILHETGYSIDEVAALASVNYNMNDMGAAVSSGPFLTEGMVVKVCMAGLLYFEVRRADAAA